MENNETIRTNVYFRGCQISESLKIIFLILGWILVLNGIFGNIIIIITLLTCKSLRSVHNIFIGNLAVADFIIESYFATYFLVDIEIGYHPVVNLTNCIINGYIVVICYMGSLWTLVSISLNRYLHICHHQVFKRLLTDARTKSHLVLVWVGAGLVSLPPLIGWGRYSYDPKSHYCGFDRLSSRSFTITLATVSVALPSSLVCYFNIAIFRGVSKSDIALVKSLFVVFLCLAVFMSPYMLSLLLDTQNTWSSAAHVACTCTSILNSSINWMLYGLMNTHFRQGYLQLLNRFLRAIRFTKSNDMSGSDSDRVHKSQESTC